MFLGLLVSAELLHTDQRLSGGGGFTLSQLAAAVSLAVKCKFSRCVALLYEALDILSVFVLTGV